MVDRGLSRHGDLPDDHQEGSTRRHREANQPGVPSAPGTGAEVWQTREDALETVVESLEDDKISRMALTHQSLGSGNAEECNLRGNAILDGNKAIVAAVQQKVAV